MEPLWGIHLAATNEIRSNLELLKVTISIACQQSARGPEGIGAVGCLVNSGVTLLVSRLTPPPQHVLALVKSVRVPNGSHEPEAHFEETDAEADNP